MNGKVKSADGVSIAYRVEGSGNPTLVFVHGWCCDKSHWDPQFSNFSQNYRAVTIDLAGHGESGLDRDKWTIAAFGEDVAAVANHLDLEQVVLIGHSMGAVVIFEAAQRIPGVVGIVGVDSLFDVNQKAGLPQLEGIATLRSSPPETVREWMLSFVSMMFIEKSDPALVERITSAISSAPREVAIGAFEEFLSYDLSQALEKATVPVWCISADYHPFDLEAARQHYPSFEVMFMSEVGHFVMLEDPVTFNRLLEEIIQNIVIK
jgi:pimeloyl-ACP methyl ester carboxylesterase